MEIPIQERYPPHLSLSSSSIHLHNNHITDIFLFLFAFAEVRPLRQALYSKLGITEGVLEEFPSWDESTQTVQWLKETVLPDATFIHLLQVSIQSRRNLQILILFLSCFFSLLQPDKLQVAFKTFFSKSDLVMAPGVEHDRTLWHNHMYPLSLPHPLPSPSSPSRLASELLSAPSHNYPSNTTLSLSQLYHLIISPPILYDVII